jgi:AcrR family transcriptional regulator
LPYLKGEDKLALSVRRIGAESSATRASILGAAQALLLDQGYGAVSTRRVAAVAGLKPSLVHYYFPTTDDLWLALFRLGADQSNAMLDEALTASDPLAALWGFFADSSRTALALEFMALANHKERLRAEMVTHSEQMRARQVEMLTKVLGEQFADADGCLPAGLTLVLAGIGRALIMEGGLGVTGGHAEARAFVEQWIGRLAINAVKA